MKLTPKTLVLLLVAVLLGVGTLIEPSSLSGSELPTVEGVPREDVTRIEITAGQVQKVAISGTWDDGYDVLQPYQGPADFMSLRPLLNAFVDDTPMDLAVDEGNLEDYGVDDQNGILVELFTTGDTPASSLVIGFDVPGGSSFVRLKDSDVVYRAKVGGRARYEHDPSHWKDRMVADWDPDAMVSLSLDSLEGRIRVEREVSGLEPGPWIAVGGPPGLELDQKALDALVSSLSVLRSGRLLSADYDAEWTEDTVRVAMVDVAGAEYELLFGGEVFDGAAYVKTPGRDEVFQVSAADRARARRSWTSLQDLTVFDYPQGSLASARLIDDGVPVTIVQTPDGMWEVADPPNVDADVKQIFLSVNSLATLRGHDRLGDGDFSLITTRIEFTTIGGEAQAVEFGVPYRDDQGRQFFPARVDGRSEVWAYRDTSVSHLRKGFGRGR